jgi:hypothetical protein
MERAAAARRIDPALMSSPERIYRGSVRALSLVMLGLGVAILAVTLAGGGGPLSVGMLMGIAFLAVGVGRLWLASRMKR